MAGGTDGNRSRVIAGVCASLLVIVVLFATLGCPTAGVVGSETSACGGFVDHVSSLPCIAPDELPDDLIARCEDIGPVCADDPFFDCGLRLTCDLEFGLVGGEECMPEVSGCEEAIADNFGV